MIEIAGSKKLWMEHIIWYALRFILALWVISILTFLLIYITPGDPAEIYLRASGIPYSQTAIEAIREEMGLNRPAYIQYIYWLTALMHGDLGQSLMLKEPVLDVLMYASINTIKLGFMSMLWLVVGSLSLSIWSIRRPNGIVDRLIQGLSLMAVSVPSFFLGYLLILVFSASLHWFPVSGMSGKYAIVLPSIALMVPMLGQTTLFFRKCFLDGMEEPHVQNAILRGVSFPYLVYNHFIKNSGAAMVTMWSWDFLRILTGSILIESVFAWPGIGSLFVKAAQNGDTPVIQGALLLFGIMAITVNKTTQGIVKWLDPRMHHQKRGTI